MPILEWLQSTALAKWISESDSMWAYPTVLALHTFGLGIVVGTQLVIDLRLLGFAPQVPIEALERFFPVMWIGFWVNAISGLGLFIAAATTKGTQPIFYVKLGLVLTGMTLVRPLRACVRFASRPAAEGDRTKRRLVAIASLAAWLGAIVAGRLMAYL
jgi:hypothetical protein